MNEFTATDDGIEVATVADLDAIRQSLPGIYAFRGQARWGWVMRSTLVRYYDEHKGLLAGRCLGGHEDSLRTTEHHLLRRFRASLDRVHYPLPADVSELDIAFLFRHFGGPTRIVDLTRELYVACAFALGRSSEDAAYDGEVVCINAASVNAQAVTHFQSQVADPFYYGPRDVLESMAIEGLSPDLVHRAYEHLVAWEGQNTWLMIVRPRLAHERFRIQSGVMMVANLAYLDPESHLPGTLGLSEDGRATVPRVSWPAEPYFPNGTAPPAPNFFRLRIPASAKARLQTELEGKGYGWDRVFPDLTEVATRVSAQNLGPDTASR